MWVREGEGGCVCGVGGGCVSGRGGGSGVGLVGV